MATLRETPNWEDNDPLYLIEPYDPILGGEYGINNIQPKQLACRTSWLKEILLKEHSTSGEHSIKVADIEESTKIDESKLALTKTTTEYSNKTADQSNTLATLRTIVDNIEGEEGSTLSQTCDALLLAWTYGDNRFAFDLFNDKFSFEDPFPKMEMIKSVVGDDSIDITDTSKCVVGGHYIIYGYDANNPTSHYSETVRVEKILSDTRMLVSVADFLSDGSKIKYDNITTSGTSCVFSRSSYTRTKNGGEFLPNHSYYTKEFTVLENYPSGKLIICQDKQATAFTVFYEDSSGFTKCTMSRTYLGSDGYYRFYYDLPGGIFRLYLENTSTDTVLVNSMAVIQDQDALVQGMVRTPQTVSPALGFRATRYGALYSIPFYKAQMQLAVKDSMQTCVVDLTGWPHSQTVEYDSKDNPLWTFRPLSGDYEVSEYFTQYIPSTTNPLLWRIRYQSAEEEWSAWSDWSTCTGVL